MPRAQFPAKLADVGPVIAQQNGLDRISLMNTIPQLLPELPALPHSGFTSRARLVAGLLLERIRS
jgi:hypothetical protein